MHIAGEVEVLEISMAKPTTPELREALGDQLARSLLRSLKTINLPGP
jgi:hypothetical protein